MIDDTSYEAFALDMERKELLFELFEDLEREEKIALLKSGLEYEVRFQGVTKVEKVESNILTLKCLKSEDLVMNVKINESIAGWLKEGDHLEINLGKLEGLWRIQFVSMIGNEDPNEPSPAMYSVPIDYTESDDSHEWIQ